MEIVPPKKVKSKLLPRLQAILSQSRNSIKQGKSLPSNHFWKVLEENTQVLETEGTSEL